ncbi:MAG: hypothetical protein R3E35_00515 [Rhodocyclaceae bacterium]
MTNPSVSRAAGPGLRLRASFLRRGLATYFWVGVALILGNAVATFVLLRKQTTARRVVMAGLAVLTGGAVWLAGLFAANFQLLCRLF